MRIGISRAQKQISVKNVLFASVLYLLIGVALFVVIFPFVWMFLTSIKTVGEVREFIFFPALPQWHNYGTVVQKINLLRSMGNTLIVAVAEIPIGLFSSLMAAYAFGKLRLRHKFAKLMLLMSAMMMPYAAILLPQYQFFRTLNMLNTLMPLILPGMFGNITAMFFFIQYMHSISDSYLEAARVDGCNSFGRFIRIVLPLMLPAIVAQIIFWFVAIWNDYFAPSIYLSDSSRMTLQVALSFLNTTNGVSDKPVVMAASCITCLPLFVIYGVFQKYFIGTLSVSGIKG